MDNIRRRNMRKGKNLVGQFAYLSIYMWVTNLPDRILAILSNRMLGPPLATVVVINAILFKTTYLSCCHHKFDKSFDSL